MDSRDETIIELSKRKLVPLLLGASVFVGAGIWMVFLDDVSIQSRRNAPDPIYVYGLGLVTIIFFGIFGLYALRKLFDRKPALIFNSSGIVDNASSVSAGLIPWSEVAGAEIVEIQKQKLLIIIVRDPQEYIARGSSLKQTLNKANYKMVGSPISISANTLKINFSELVSLFDRYQRKYGVAPEDADMRYPYLGHDGDFSELDGEPKAQLLNWSPFAVRGTVGSGGVGILVLFVSSLDMLFHIQIPFWAAVVVSMLPMFIFFVAVPDFLPRRIVGPAQWFAAVWYLVFAVLSLSLAAYRGFETPDVLLAGFVVLGTWACLVAVRKLRVAHEA
ncbi:MAG TPA: STM3941 family protein [Pyrinomonadaceae bacterium]|nr:STM3941 family protein [Pyrinomonadaceae bacterium]